MNWKRPRLDWEGLFLETRGYLGFDDDDPVPLDEPRVVLDDTAADTDDEDPDTADDTLRVEDEKSARDRTDDGETPENVTLDPTPEIEPGTFPDDLKGIAQWLA